MHALLRDHCRRTSASCVLNVALCLALDREFGDTAVGNPVMIEVASSNFDPPDASSASFWRVVWRLDTGVGMLVERLICFLRPWESSVYHARQLLAAQLGRHARNLILARIDS